MMKNFGQTLVWMKSLDMTCVNAWILHRRINKDSQLRLIDFKLELADTLLTQNTCPYADYQIVKITSPKTKYSYRTTKG